MRSNRRALLVAAACAALIGGAGGLAAQGAGSIRGRVVEGTTLRPLAGVQVSVPGTGRGALTGATGEYLIQSVPLGEHSVRAEMLGYRSQTLTLTVTAAQAVTADFSLAQAAISLDEIVVTGTAGAVSKRTLGNSITKVDAAGLADKTAVTNVTEMLSAQAPGLTIVSNAGTPGAASEIRIRGAASFIRNQPVIYVDGVKVSSDWLGNFTPSGSSVTSYTGQTTSALDLINPNDIESVEVIKGPAAATLYGADAAGGVIQIITKKGTRGSQPMRFDMRVEEGINDWALPTPVNYTICTPDKISAVDATGYPVWPGCQGMAAGTVLKDEPMRRDPQALRTGALRQIQLSARGGSDVFNYYVSGQTNLNQGVFYNSDDNTTSLRANFQATPSPRVDFGINTSYIRGDLQLPLGDESIQALLLSASRGQPGHVPTNRDSTRAGWYSTTPAMANSYDNNTKSDRFILGTTINARPLDWFRNRLTLGLDFMSGLAQVISPPGSVDADYAGMPEGVVAQRFPRRTNLSLDYAGNATFRPLQDLEATTSFGVQATAYKYNALYAQGRGFGAPDVTLIGSAAANTGDNSISESRSLGFWGQEQFGWKDRLYVTGALRMDNSSVFGTEVQRIFYPKLSLSWIASDEPFLRDRLAAIHVDNLKVRAAWGEAGRAPDPFAASQTYTLNKGVIGSTIVSVLQANAYGNPDLKPERGREFEAGFEASLLHDRAGIDFTYYNKKMSDVIVSSGVAGSSGFGGTFFGSTLSRVINLGETANSGMELALTGTPIMRRNFSWDLRLNLATNSNELVSFGDGRTSDIVSGQSYGTVQYQKVGYPLAGYWAKLPLRNADGTPVVDASGIVQQTDTAVYIGPSMPTREAGISSTFTFFRNFSLYAFLDYKGGHYLFDYKDFSRCRVYANCDLMADPKNVDLATGTLLNPEASVWTQNIAGAWIRKADFLKLRDVSLTYRLPPEWARQAHASAASLTVAGHNLAQFTGYPGIDPEVNSYGNRSFARADVYPAPMMRRLSVSLNLSF